MRGAFFRSILLGALLAFGYGAGTACRTTPKIDWNSRVNSYSYDQAVLDFGPPDRSAKLSDGSTVAEWIRGRNSGTGLSLGVGTFGSHSGASVGQTINTSSGSRVLRLVFGTDNLLKSWSGR